jgi:hypothetical protein
MLYQDFVRIHRLISEEYTHSVPSKDGPIATPSNYTPGKFEGDAISSRDKLPYNTLKVDRELRDGVHDESKNILLKTANDYTREKFGRTVDASSLSKSSLRKQYAIAQAGKLAEDGHPEYEKAVYADYKKNKPDVVGNAPDYKSLVDNAYKAVKNETMEQLHRLPLKIQFHPGTLNYHDSNELFRDMHLHKHIATFQGGDPHEHLHEIHPTLGVSSNDIFRVVHDGFGHGISGASFGAQGEEHAYQLHSQMYSPLARIAVSGETRRQNSLVNYSDQNLDLVNHMEKLRKEKQDHIKSGNVAGINDTSAKLRELGGTWKYAKQKSCALPPEMDEPDYKGECPDYVKKLIRDPQADVNPEYDVDKDHLHLVKLAKTWNTGSYQSADPTRHGKLNSEQATSDLYHMAKMHGFTSVSKYPF